LETIGIVHVRKGDLDSLGVLSMLDITGPMKLFGRSSKVKQVQLGCSSLMFAIAHLCPRRDCSVRCAGAGDRAVVTILFLQIVTDARIEMTVPGSPGELSAGSGPTGFEDDN
jgi:hypothetical protein